MSNQVFPDLPGFTISVHRQPEWKTSIKEAWSGVETRTSQRPWPRWRFTINCDVLRVSEGDLDTLQAFFNAHMGAFDSFLFNDLEYHSVANQAFGTGDGTATLFQLARAVGTWLEPVWSPAGSPAPVIKKNGITLLPVTDYTIGSTGQIQFNAAPAAGHLLTWSGNYYMRVRFADDKLDFERLLWGLWKTSKIELLSEVFPT